MQDKSLRELPYKVELDECGRVVMTLASNRHGYLQSRLGWMFRQNIEQREIISECPADTPKESKVADVAWCSDQFIAQHFQKGAK